MSKPKHMHSIFFIGPWLLLSLPLLFPARGCGRGTEGRDKPPCQLVFWNVENYFDPFPDSLSTYTEYDVGGAKHWSWKRFEQKRNGLAKTLLILGAPPLVALVEVENAWVLWQLAQETPLSRYGYKVIHRQGPDRRGIEAGLLYRPEAFRPLHWRGYALPPPWDRSREILYVKGLWGAGQDTLHLFVNHWPSKRGGAKASLPGRMAAAALLDRLADSVLTASPQARLVAMGDFNDPPGAPPLQQLHRWHNLMQASHATYKYRGKWACIDQVLVAGNWESDGGDRAQEEEDRKHNAGDRMHKEEDRKQEASVLRLGPHSAWRVEVGALPHLLERDGAHGGLKPKPTYTGPQYRGGVSDHLPVCLWWE